MSIKGRVGGFLLGMMVGGVIIGVFAVTYVLVVFSAVDVTTTTVPIKITPEPVRVIVEINSDLPAEVYEVTAYTAGPESTGKTEDHPAYGITASGAEVKENHTLACPKNLAFGTRVYIPYFNNVFTCEDRGAAITDGKLDVYMSNLSDALEFGRRKLDVVILTE